MNKRIKKKNDFVRINDMLITAMYLIDEYMIYYEDGKVDEIRTIEEYMFDDCATVYLK